MVLHHLENKIPAYEVSVTLRATDLRADGTRAVEHQYDDCTISETPPHLQFQVGF